MKRGGGVASDVVEWAVGPPQGRQMTSLPPGPIGLNRDG